MFTGIIESLGTVVGTTTKGSNLDIELSSPIAGELKVDQSLSHNGVCLTVTACSSTHYSVTAIEETLSKTALGKLQTGDVVNLERCMAADGRFDGHMVYGHVDTVGVCQEITDVNGSHVFRVNYPSSQLHTVVEKGSICLNGISLTVFDTTDSEFSVAIIPYTFEHTNMKFLKVGDSINLEFDILGKYIYTILEKQGKVL